MPIRRATAASLAALLSLTVAACASGQKDAPQEQAAAEPTLPFKIADQGYLPAGALDSLVLLPPPPAAGSPTAIADRAVFDATRVLEGSPRWKQATRDADLAGPEMFKSTSCVIGAAVDARSTPALARLWSKMFRDSITVSTPVKERYMRTRPLIGNDKPICTAREKWLETNGSYPSGHSMIGWSWALVLAEVAPDRADAILKRGRDFGDSRIICGVHFQSDVEAGRDLAGAMVSRLHAEAGFNADVAAARRELAAVRAKGVKPEGCGELVLN